jgi:hypothetical protein
VVLSSAVAAACNNLPSGQMFWIRLSSPVTTYTAKPGDPVTAILTQDVECDNDVVFPLGTPVSGVVTSVRKVGWGIRHETAALGVRFTEATPSGREPVAISAAVVEIENAREQVSAKGTIQGIRSSDSPQGRINSRLRHLPTWNPYSDVGLIVFKASFPIFPEPEIYFPAGTDIHVKLTAPVSSVPLPLMQTPSLTDAAESSEVDALTEATPIRSTTPAQVNADIVNLAFVGSRQQLESAFHEAGWDTSDAFNKHSFMRDFYAFLNNSGYAQAPMRPFLLAGRPADMSWQKSLNSYARRDHLRIWEWSPAPDSRTLWLSSSTHDSSAALSLKHREFVHHIAPNIDEERGNVIRDLTVAGCVQSVHMVPRSSVPNFTQNATGDLIRTDGALAVVELKDCQPTVPEMAAASQAANFKAGNHVFRYCRRQILTFRSDIWRANIIYGFYDLGRMSFVAMKHHSEANTERQLYAEREQAIEVARQRKSKAGDSSYVSEPVSFR